MGKQIFIIGQCSLHWGRMEFGNIGNYYILKPMFEELRRVFPGEKLLTTMQLSDSFCKKYDVELCPLEAYYDFSSAENLQAAKEEYANKENKAYHSVFLDIVRRSDLVIDFSGDIWGDNADFLGSDRFEVGLYKDLTAQHHTKTVLFSCSPGPFGTQEKTAFAKRVLQGFDLVINREPVSTELLRQDGCNMENVLDFPCPSFLFEAADAGYVEDALALSSLPENGRPKIGVILCGWNFKKKPYDLWPRQDDEYNNFVELLIYLIEKYNAQLFLLSHSNGFDISPKPFVMRHGRDYPIVEQLHRILVDKGYEQHTVLVKQILSPEITKGFIASFDLLISGRLHGAVAGISQSIPTVILDYGHEPKAHKLKGYAEVCEMSDYVANPNNLQNLIFKAVDCFQNREKIAKHLQQQMKEVKQKAKAQFDCLKALLYTDGK